MRCERDLPLADLRNHLAWEQPLDHKINVNGRKEEAAPTEISKVQLEFIGDDSIDSIESNCNIRKINSLAERVRTQWSFMPNFHRKHNFFLTKKKDNIFAKPK